MRDGVIGPYVNVKTLVGQEMLQDQILPELAEGKADIFPLLFGCPRFSPGAKADDPAAQISHAVSWFPLSGSRLSGSSGAQKHSPHVLVP